VAYVTGSYCDLEVAMRALLPLSIIKQLCSRFTIFLEPAPSSSSFIQWPRFIIEIA